MNRKSIIALLCALLCMALLGSAVAETTITYIASQDWVQDAEMELGEKFYEETGIKVDYQIVPADQYTNLLMTKLNAGECADIFGSQAGQFDIVTQLNVEKNAVDLSAEEWVTRMDPLAGAEVSVDGKVYGQPVQDLSAVWAVAYNKQIFADLSLSVPTTFDEFKAVCEAIKAAGSADPAAIKAALPNVTYTGISGAIAFDEIGDAARDTAYIKTANTETGLWDFVSVQGVN